MTLPLAVLGGHLGSLVYSLGFTSSGDLILLVSVLSLPSKWKLKPAPSALSVGVAALPVSSADNRCSQPVQRHARPLSLAASSLLVGVPLWTAVYLLLPDN